MGHTTLQMSAWEPPVHWEWVGGLPGVRIYYDHRFEASGPRRIQVVRATASAESRGFVDSTEEASRMPAHLTAEQRQLALRLKARGLSSREVEPQVGCSHPGVALIARHSPRRSVRQDRWVPGPGRLTLADREAITLGVHAGESFTVIAARLGKAISMVSREVAANGGRAQYRAWRAHQRAQQQARRPRPRSWPIPRWPPGSAAGWNNGGRRCRSRPGRGSSSQATHDAGEPRNHLPGLDVQGRGELRRELARCLRTGRATRLPVAAWSTPASSGTW
jgi:IS30 family transposase